MRFVAIEPNRLLAFQEHSHGGEIDRTRTDVRLHVIPYCDFGKSRQIVHRPNAAFPIQLVA